MIKKIRLKSQQLLNPCFDNPKDLVTWMGAIQAQDYRMLKWALGVRLKSATLYDVDESLRKGEILRTHVMRPTWHLVAAEDIRWMVKLSSKKLMAAWSSADKKFGLTEDLYNKSYRLIEKMLEGNKSLTRQEIALEFNKSGIAADEQRASCFIFRAEAEAIICSGVDKDKKATYALLEERVPPAKDLHKEEALAKLAKRYFQSHSPASLQDFVWWSGLSITDARHAIGLIEQELIKDRFLSEELFIHQSYGEDFKPDKVLHFLPPYDEYLISYKDRTAVLPLEHYPKAFNNFGIFYPVILCDGKIVGNWKKAVKKGEIVIETSFFEEGFKANKDHLKTAEKRYKIFMS